MRHKYVTRALVVQRVPLAESAALVTLLTEDLGLVRARAEGLRKPGAKLAHALQTFSEVESTLVRGKEGWRLSGAVLLESWFLRLTHTERLRSGRIAGLMLRLIPGEIREPGTYAMFLTLLSGLPKQPEEVQDAMECRAALTLLQTLGLDSGSLPESVEMTALTSDSRRDIVARINRGIQASGL